MRLKLLLFAALLGCGLTFSSCDKEEINSAKLEGTWNAYKAELLFDGKVVVDANVPTTTLGMFMSMSFSDGYATIVDEEGSFRATYTFANNILTLSAIIVSYPILVKKLTQTELVIEQTAPYVGTDMVGYSCAKYNGKEIYQSDDDFWGIHTYWYISGGKVVNCEPLDEDDFSLGWVDTARGYFKRVN